MVVSNNEKRRIKRLVNKYCKYIHIDFDCTPADCCSLKLNSITLIFNKFNKVVSVEETNIEDSRNIMQVLSDINLLYVVSSAIQKLLKEGEDANDDYTV